MPTLPAGCGDGSGYEFLGFIIVAVFVLSGLLCLGVLMTVVGAGMMVCTRGRDSREKQPPSCRIGKRIMIARGRTLVVLVGFPVIVILSCLLLQGF